MGRQGYKFIFSVGLFCLVLLASNIASIKDVSAAVLHDYKLDWYTIESKHFRCHFHTGEEELARKTLRIAEDVHVELSVLMDWKPVGKTDLILTDEFDIPNGNATPFPTNRSGIFLSGPDSVDSLEDVSDWLETVIKHEYLHILHLDKATGSASAIRKIFGRALYIFPFFTAFPNAYQPAWIVEGLATYIETDKKRGIGRGQSSYYDMFMRMEALGEFKSLAHVNVPNVTEWPMNTSRYLYGVHFFQFIEEKYGKQKITDLVDNYSNNLIPWQLNSNATESIGKNLYALWDEFELSTKEKYKSQQDKVLKRGELKGEQLTTGGYFTGPLSVLDSGDIYYLDYNADQNKSLKVLQPKKSGGYKKPREIIDVRSLARLDVHSTAGVLLAKAERCRNAALYYDLFHIDLKTGKQTRLTDCGRYRMAAWNPDGTKIIAVKNGLAVNELHLLNAKGEKQEVLWKGDMSVVVSSLDWSPTDSTIIASVFRPNTGWNLEIFDLKTKQWAALTEDDVIETTPTFTADGKTILYSADNGGVYNIYSLNLETKETKSLTDLVGGAFYPIQTKNDQELYYIGYTSAGFDVFKMQIKETREVPAANQAPTAIAKTVVPEELSNIEISQIEEYSPAESITPRWYHPIVAISEDYVQVGAFTAGWDTLTRHIYGLSLSYINYDADYSDWVGSVDYIYDRYYPLLKLHASRENDLFRDTKDNLVRVRDNDVFQAEVVFPLLTTDDRLSFHLAAIQDKTSDAWRKNNTISTINSLEDNLLGAAVVYNNTSTHPKSVSRAEGRVLQFIAEDSDKFGSSDFSGNVYTADWREYIRLGGAHVLALRAAVGDGSRRTRDFRLGGTNNITFEPSLLAPTVASSPFNRRDYNLRGYNEGRSELRGSNMQLMSIEYRFPIWRLERVAMTPPIGIQYISAAVFVDRGAAWNDGAAEKYYTGTGVELYVDTIFGYNTIVNITFGYAYGSDSVIGEDQYYVRIGGSF